MGEKYTAALTGYAASVLMRRFNYSTRGARLRPYKATGSRQQNWVQVGHIFTSEASIGFSYDHFETALGDEPSTWPSLADDTIAVLRNQAARPRPARRPDTRVGDRPGDAERVALRCDHRPAIRQDDRLLGRVEPDLRVTQARPRDDRPLVRVHRQPGRRPGEVARGDRQARRNSQHRPQDP